MKEITNWQNNSFYYNQPMNMEEYKKEQEQYRKELITEILENDLVNIWEARLDTSGLSGESLVKMLDNMANVDLVFLKTILSKRKQTL